MKLPPPKKKNKKTKMKDDKFYLKKKMVDENLFQNKKDDRWKKEIDAKGMEYLWRKKSKLSKGKMKKVLSSELETIIEISLFSISV